jgi:hypothetical protein
LPLAVFDGHGETRRAASVLHREEDLREQRLEVPKGDSERLQPFGYESFANEMGERFGRQWTRGRPGKEPAAKGKKLADGSAEEAKTKILAVLGWARNHRPVQ